MLRLSFVVAAIAFGGLMPPVASAADRSASSEFETVELKMISFAGEDGYPSFVTIDPNGPFGSVKASLRCVDYAWDGKLKWQYREIMFFDPRGKNIRRRESQPNVSHERGYTFAFATADECASASPSEFSSDATCILRVQVNRKKLVGANEKEPLGIARLISSDCAPRATKNP